MPLGRADQHNRDVTRNQTFQQIAGMRQRRNPVADRGEAASVLVDRLFRDTRSVALPEQFLEQSLPPHADQPVRTGRGDIKSARTNRGRPRAGMQVGRVDQRAIDIDQRRRTVAAVDARRHVTVPSSSRAPDPVPAAGCPARAAPDPAHWAAWAARGPAAKEPAAPASAALPAAAAWTTLLAWRLTTRAGGPRNRGRQRRVGAGRNGRPQAPPLRSDLVDSALDLLGGVVHALLEIALGLVALALGLELWIVLELARLLLGGALHVIDLLTHVLVPPPGMHHSVMGSMPAGGAG